MDVQCGHAGCNFFINAGRHWYRTEIQDAGRPMPMPIYAYNQVHMCLYTFNYVFRNTASVEINNCFYEKPPGFLRVYLEAGWRPVRVNISLPSRMMAFSQGGSFRPAS
jgi:hypothetical protein